MWGLSAFWLEWVWLAVAASGVLISWLTAYESFSDRNRTRRRKKVSAANLYLAQIIWVSSVWVVCTHLLLLGGACAAVFMAPPPPWPTKQMHVVIMFLIMVDLAMTGHAWAGKRWRRRLAEGDFDEEEINPKKNGGKGLLGGNGHTKAEADAVAGADVHHTHTHTHARTDDERDS